MRAALASAYLQHRARAMATGCCFSRGAGIADGDRRGALAALDAGADPGFECMVRSSPPHAGARGGAPGDVVANRVGVGGDGLASVVHGRPAAGRTHPPTGVAPAICGDADVWGQRLFTRQ